MWTVPTDRNSACAISWSGIPLRGHRGEPPLGGAQPGRGPRLGPGTSTPQAAQPVRGLLPQVLRAAVLGGLERGRQQAARLDRVVDQCAERRARPRQVQPALAARQQVHRGPQAGLARRCPRSLPADQPGSGRPRPGVPHARPAQLLLEQGERLVACDPSGVQQSARSERQGRQTGLRTRCITSTTSSSTASDSACRPSSSSTLASASRNSRTLSPIARLVRAVEKPARRPRRRPGRAARTENAWTYDLADRRAPPMRFCSVPVTQRLQRVAQVAAPPQHEAAPQVHRQGREQRAGARARGPAPRPRRPSVLVGEQRDPPRPPRAARGRGAAAPRSSRANRPARGPFAVPSLDSSSHA